MYLSIREARDENISKLKSYRTILNKLIDQMTQELGSQIKDKELSKRFWDALPADIRNKYMIPIMSLREKVRNIYQQYPQHFEEYKNENKPYFFQKEREDKKRRQEIYNKNNQNILTQEIEPKLQTIKNIL